MRERLFELELMDLGEAYYTAEEYRDALEQLDRIGRWLGGDAVTFRAFSTFNKPASILEVGCGGGHLAVKLGNRYPATQVTGIDISRLAIDCAHQKKDRPSNVHFEWREAARLQDPPESYDIVTSSLVCHHMDDEEIVDFLRRAWSISKQGVIINDLHRHPLAYHAFRLLARLFFRNRLVIHDGPLSVKRAFTRKDWVGFLAKAGIPEECYSVKWGWAFRWAVIIRKRS